MSLLMKIRKKIKEYNCDGLLITNPISRRYISGFTGTAGTILVTENREVFMTDFRYEKQAKSEVKDFEVVIFSQSNYMFETILTYVSDLKINKLAVESDHMSYIFFEELKNKVSADLIATKALVSELRAIKTPEEIKKIKKAATITDKAFGKIKEFIKPGTSELEVANNLEFILKELGSDMNSRSMTVASGYRSAFPHGRPSEKIIENDEMITLDFGAIYQGYHSDMTRTIMLGNPNQELKEIYRIVSDALELCKSEIKVGMTGKEVDSIVRGFINEKGYGKYFGHGSGHGIGLALHEDPFFSSSSDHVLHENMVITIEPGIYLPDLGGVRIEDNLIIKNTEHEVITNSPRDTRLS